MSEGEATTERLSDLRKEIDAIDAELVRLLAARLKVVQRVVKVKTRDGLPANAGAWIASLSLEECAELYQVRERIEPLLLRYSLPHLTPADVDRLAELVEEMRNTSDIEWFLALDREFHLGSYRGADTTFLGPTVARLWNNTQHYRRAFTRLLDVESNRIVHDEHHMLVAAIRENDPDEAERVLFGHIRRTRLQLARHPEVFADQLNR